MQLARTGGEGRGYFAVGLCFADPQHGESVAFWTILFSLGRIILTS